MDFIEECVAPSMAVKIESDSVDAVSSQVPDAIFPCLWNGSETDIDSLVKKECDITVKTEDESDERTIKQELDIGPTVLQPKRSLHFLWSGTSESLQEADSELPTGAIFDQEATPELPCTSESSLLPRLSQQYGCHRTEVENEYCEEDSDVPPHLRSMLEEKSKEGAYQRMLTFYDCYDDEDALDGSQCRYCVKPLTECSCSENLSMFERDTDEEVNENPFESKCCKSPKDGMKEPMLQLGNDIAQKPKGSDRRVYEQAGEKAFKCDWCKYSTSQLSDLAKHLCIHTGADPYKWCKQCESSASQLSNSKIHNCTHNDEKPFKCGHCEYSSFHMYSLKRHMRIHSDYKPYECEYCEYKTFQRVVLKRHTLIHTGERPYKCQQCEYSASLLRNLKRHMRTHTGDKPYKCEQCDYRASELGRIKAHRQTHMREKLYYYACKQCRYNTSQLSALKRHIEIHAGLKPIYYACKQCEYSTSQLSNLKRHIDTHTDKRPYKCGECNYSASQINAVKMHIRTHKKEKL